jgi:periplasmic protein TonB
VDELTTANEGEAPVRDRLQITLFLAALFHGIIILGISFGAPAFVDNKALPTLEVLLVGNNLPESAQNPDANYLANRTQQGAGNTTEDQRAESPETSLVPFDNAGIPQGQALVSQDAGREQAASADLLATTGDSAQATHSSDSAETQSTSEQTALLMHAGPVSPIPSNDDDAAVVLKGRNERELVVTPNTRESAVAVYLDAWKHKVERIGTLNYPNEARRRGLSGSPVLEVAINANGEMEDIVVRRTSGHPELDQAALAILKLATPFDPFPSELRKRHGSIRFAYEWQFLSGALVDTSVKAVTPP